jgi:hypothetical protein
MQKKVLKVNPKDNIIVALMDLHAGEIVHLDGADYTVLKDTKAKHKFAAEDFAVGDHIIMYGVIVGKANHPIQKGEVITTENVKHESEEVFKKTGNLGWTPPNVDKWKDKTFNGYHRADGQVGTKNVWLFFPLVFCENKNIEKLKDIFENELLPKKEVSYKNFLRSLIEEKSDTTSKESILISSIFMNYFKENKDLTLEELITLIVTPPFSKIGVFDLETFFAQSERLKLALKLNNIIANPSFKTWIEGETLDISNLLYDETGKAKVSIFSIAHLNDSQRRFLCKLYWFWCRKSTG